MRHDTNTTPTGARGSTMASSLSAMLDALEGELHYRYAHRPGELEPGQESGWCTACGGNRVFPLDGEETCRACIAELTGVSAGRQA